MKYMFHYLIELRYSIKLRFCISLVSHFVTRFTVLSFRVGNLTPNFGAVEETI
jgi:hypothetical protein